ncbi:MAG: twin-arginine translocation signal domain-containing protein [Rhodobacteraceae bacterium]|nr:twin-arginine translocation signal domain-containing protein [Paracoccaceae bacterium]
MSDMDHEQPGRRHPLIDEAAASLRAGRLSRRGFLRAATLLGAPLGSALGWIGPVRAEDAATEPVATDAPPVPKEGGVLRVAMHVHPVSDPARHSWVEMSNLTRHQNEHLTITGADNITRPMLAEGWSASDDLKTWTFTLRPGVKWHNGDDFTTEDVAFNVNRWLDPELRSSNAALLGAMTEIVDTGEKDADGAPVMARRPIEGAVEVVDPLTLRLHLAQAALSLPETMFNYPTAIVHRGFEGDVVAERNGTGAYQIIELQPGVTAALRKVRQDGWSYWGAEVPHIGPGYLDEIRYLHHEPASQASVTAVLSDTADMNHAISPEWLEIAELVPGATIYTTDTAQTGVMRMRVDEAPFDDLRVRRAVQLCCDAEPFVLELFKGRGQPGEHHHVSPIHPDYFPLPRLTRDPAKARELLAEAGYPEGIDLTLTVGNTSGVWQQRAAEYFAAQAAEAGVRIALDVVPPERYHEIWRTTAFGMTHWTHRPLGTMALSLAYRESSPWNETGFSDPEFEAALDQAEALIDVNARREAMQPVEQRLQDAAVIIQPIWAPTFFLATNRVHGLEAHPAQYHLFNNVWLDA